METDESFDRLLAVVAHPEDLQYGAPLGIARWSAAVLRENTIPAGHAIGTGHAVAFEEVLDLSA